MTATSKPEHKGKQVKTEVVIMVAAILLCKPSVLIKTWRCHSKVNTKITELSQVSSTAQ